MLSVRPKVTELAFQLYGRSLHPELFEHFQSRSIQRGEYEADLSITGSGHLVTWRHQGLVLTEVTTCLRDPLPQKRRLISYRLRGERSDRMECRGGVSYQMSFLLEFLEPEVFWSFQQELSDDGEKQGLMHRFDPHDRMALGSISLVNIETRTHSMLVQAFHTFPDELAIVKSQSIFEIR